MKIAQVSPLYESVPPKSYGGTERVVSYLTEELIAQGHDVTLFASGDSQTHARLISPCKRSLRTDMSCTDPIAYHVLMLEQVAKLDQEFDIVHYHVDYLHYQWARRQNTAHLTTLHGRLDLPQLAPLYREFREVPLISISNAQRRPIPWANWRGRSATDCRMTSTHFDNTLRIIWPSWAASRRRRVWTTPLKLRRRPE